MPRQRAPHGPKTLEMAEEERNYLKSLIAHGKVIEAEREDVELPPGVTHVLVKKPGKRGRLIEKRKSFF